MCSPTQCYVLSVLYNQVNRGESRGLVAIHGVNSLSAYLSFVMDPLSIRPQHLPLGCYHHARKPFPLLFIRAVWSDCLYITTKL